MNICRSIQSINKHAPSSWFTLRVVKKLSSTSRRDVTLDYQVYNDFSSKIPVNPIFISHGIFGSKKNWHSLCKVLNKMTGRMVVAYDAINHGNSSHHDCMSYEAMSEDLTDLMRKLNAEQSVLIGHSMGGKVAMTSALMYPGQVSQLVVVDTSPSVSRSLGEVFTYIQGMLAMNMPTIKAQEEVDAILSKFVKSNFMRQFLMRNLETRRGEFLWRCNLTAMSENYPLIRSFPSFSDKVYFDKPTLFIGGGRSSYITEEDVPVIKTRFPSSVIQHIANAGHWVHSEKPNEFLRLVTDFINKESS